MGFVIANSLEEKDKTDIQKIKLAIDSLQIIDQDSYNFANEIANKCVTKTKDIEEQHEPAIKSAYKAHKDAIALRDSRIFADRKSVV